MTARGLVDQYYGNVEDYFEYTGNSKALIAATITYLITRKHMFCDQSQIKYFQKDEIASESQEKTANDIKITSPEDKTQDILFDRPHIKQSNTPNFINPFENPIMEEYLPGPNQTVYRCREHPDKYHIDLEGLELNHFKLVHTKEGK